MSKIGSIVNAPIVFFTYNRIFHARNAINSLLMCPEASQTDIFIYSDGAKGENDKDEVQVTRTYIHSISGFKSITIVEREKNWGLANSLIDGITTTVNRYGKVIVVEDDLVVSPYFLRYMNDALCKYADDDRISAVSAFLNPVRGRIPEYFFLRYFACWGWGTWKRGWDLFNPDVNDLISQFKYDNQKYIYDIDGSAYFYSLLPLQAQGKIDSWASRFYASSFLAGKLVLFPGRTMVVQTGMDGSGVHCGVNNHFEGMKVSGKPISLVEDIRIEASQKMYKKYKRFYQKCSGNDLWSRTKKYGFRVLRKTYHVLTGSLT